MNSTLINRHRGLLCLAALAMLAVAFGCGSSGSSGGGTGSTPIVQTPVALTVDWPSRTRANVANVTAPAAALSVVATLTATGSTTATKLAPAFNRDTTTIAEYVASYTSTTTVPVGTYHVHLDFFSETGGIGSVVGFSDSTATIAAGGSGIGTVSLTSTITSVTVNPINALNIGVPTQLTFSARTANGDITPVSPGSGSWSVVSQSGVTSTIISLTGDGIITAGASGTATVQVRIGSVTSPAANITIGSGVGFSDAISSLSVIGNNGQPAPIVVEPSGFITTVSAGAPPTIDSNNPATVVRGGSLLVTVVTPQPVDSINLNVEGEQNTLVAQVNTSTPALLDNARTASGIKLYSAKAATQKGLFTKYGYYAKSHLAPGVVAGTTYEMAISVPPTYTGSNFNIQVSSTLGGVMSQPATVAVHVDAVAATSNFLQFSINWSAPVDIDLHCICPDGEEIYYANRTGQNGGTLDRDSNPACDIDGIDNENITWPSSRPAAGVYQIRPDLYDNCGLTGTIPYIITINNNGRLSVYQGSFNASESDQNSTENNGHLIYAAFGTETELAGLIQTNSNITLATAHPGGQVDNATAAQNIANVATTTTPTLEANRSSYTDPVYGTGPGGQTPLDTRMLGVILCYAQLHQITIAEIAGGVHVANSRHYQGMAFDISAVDGTNISASAPIYTQYESELQTVGGQEIEGPETSQNPHQIHVAVLPPGTY